MRHSMINRVCLLSVLVVCFAVASVSGAGIINLEEGTYDLDGLLGDNIVAKTNLLTTVMNSQSIQADVFSRAYADDAGLYAYLYQVENTGTAGYSAIELFTLWPFTDATDNTRMGWLSDTPTGFLASGQAPESTGFIDDLPVVSFYYGKRNACDIDIGENSRVMYVLSALAPGEILGNVIGGSVGSGDVVGPVPEPGTWMLLASGLAVLVVYRRRRRA